MSLRMVAVGALALMAVEVVAAPAGAAVAPANELVVNGSLDGGTKGWWSTKNTPIKVDGGRLCAQVPAGGDNVWAAMVGQSKIAFEAGTTYQLSFEASATKTTRIRSVVQRGTEPHTAVVDGYPEITSGQRTYVFTGTSKITEPEGQVLFQVGGAAEPYTLCLDEISFTGGQQ